MLHSVFLTDYFKHKTVYKTACRTSSANPLQLQVIKAFRISWFIWQSIFHQFWIVLILFYNGFFWERFMQNNLFSFVTIQRYYNGYNTSKTPRKEGGTNFVLLSCSRIVIWQFIKTYSQRLIKILQFLISDRIQKCWT